MQIVFWGVRGSVPTPGQATVRYGGNTPCIQLLPDPGENGGLEFEAGLVLDAGSGLRLLGNQLLGEENSRRKLDLHLLLTHFHWDHIQGIPFFRPLFDPDAVISFYGPVAESIRRNLELQMSAEFFPVPFDNIPARLEFVSVPREGLSVGPFLVRYQFVNHGNLGSVVGYRVECNQKCFVYIPDIEPYDLSDQHDRETILKLQQAEKDLVEFIHGADVVVFDTMFTEEEYHDHRGWGHSPMRYAIEIAARAKARKLGFFHYDPLRTDAEIDRLLDIGVEQGKKVGLDVFASREGEIVQIT